MEKLKTSAATNPSEAIDTLEAINAYDIVKQQIDACAAILDLSPDVATMLKTPMRELHVALPVRMDDGRTRVFQAFRVQHNDALGIAKGGIRFHPEETIDTVRALAAWMTWKCALLELPLGGGKGGVVCNPKDMSPGELERVSRAYVRGMFQFIGPDKDVPAPDVYTNPQVMAWMMDEYSAIMGRPQFGVVTGKPPVVGGSLGRGDATARGGMYTIREAAATFGIDLSRATVAVQGYGNAGYHAARLCSELFGARIVGICDSIGGVCCTVGADPEAAYSCKAQTGSVCYLPDMDRISNEELLEMDVDILIPAAIENVITDRNADRIKARIVAELANGPTTPEADEILYQKGIHVIPDILCNAGGVTVSYLEMVQDFCLHFWDEAEVRERLDRKMTAAYHAVLKTSREHKINMRQAAYVRAVDRVVQAMKLRGWV